MLQGFRDNKPPFPLPFALNPKATRPLIDGFIGTVGLAAACVMAGTGDLAVLRTLRALRWKVDDVAYGTHLSLAMSIGILFLAGGRAALRRDPEACASLLLATAPRFPSRTVDNQYHLQALRHLYVLAVEQRALQVVDVDTGGVVSTDVDVEHTDGTTRTLRAPCLLPELATVRRVSLAAAAHAGDGPFYPTSMVITPPEDGDGGAGTGVGVGVGVGVSTAPHVLFVKRRPSRPAATATTTTTSTSTAAAAAATSDAPRGRLPLGTHAAMRQTLRARLLGSRTQQQAQRAVDEGAAECQMHLETLLGLVGRGPAGDGRSHASASATAVGQDTVAQALLAGKGAPMAMDVCWQAIRDSSLC